MDLKPKREADVEKYNPTKVYNREEMIAATSLLQIKTTEARKITINWALYAVLNLIETEDVEFMTNFDRLGHKDLPDKEPNLCATVFLKLLITLNKDIAIKYLIVSIDDILSEDKSRVQIFRNPSLGNVWPYFFKLMYHEDLFVKHMSARIVAKLACWHPQLMEENDLDHYLSWLMEELKKIDNEYIQSVARCLQMMLRVDHYRLTFLSLDGLSTLLSLLASKLNFQIQYQLIFCLWLITFNPLLAEKMAEYNVISVLADILKETVKEKVSRIVLAVYRNMIEKHENPQVSKKNCIAMVQNKVLKQLYILNNRSSDDEDFMNDVAFLNERLQASMQDLSSFDQYTTEIKTLRLEWSPVHKSAKFWRENVARFTDNGQELLRGLLEVMNQVDPVVLAVACFDLGEYVRYYPRGKHIIDQLGLKERVMSLLSHEDPNVRYEALIAVQKIMVPNWEYLGKQLDSELSKKPTHGTAAGAKS